VVHVVLMPPPLLALVAAVAQRGVAGAPPARSAGRTAMTATLSAASVSMAGDAASRFRRSGTTLEPFHPDQASVLITSGANVITRNPMYVGMAGLLVAHAAWRASVAALFPAVAFVVLIDRLQIQAAESALLQKFGADYESYCAKTPRWLGRRSLHNLGAAAGL